MAIYDGIGTVIGHIVVHYQVLYRPLERLNCGLCSVTVGNVDRGRQLVVPCVNSWVVRDVLIDSSSGFWCQEFAVVHSINRFVFEQATSGNNDRASDAASSRFITTENIAKASL